MITAQVTFTFGSDEDSSEITKCLLINRKARVEELVDEISHIPKLMHGIQVAESYNTMIFALKDNRKSQGRR